MPQIKCKAWSCRGGVVVGPYDQERVCKECNGTGYVEGEEKKAEFQPAFDMPATREQALECLKKWGDPLCATFNAERAKRMWELLKEPTPEAAQEPVAWAETDEHGEIAWGEEGCFSNDPAWIENPIPLYTAPPAAEINAEHLEALRKRFVKLPKYSFLLNESGGVARVPDRSGAWVEWYEVHQLFDPVVADAAIAAAEAHKGSA